MIPGEKKFVLVEIDYMSTSMTGSWNSNQIAVEINFPLSFENSLNSQPAGSVGGVHDAFAAEFLGKKFMSGYVVFMRQDHASDTSHVRDSLHQLAGEPRGINQHVATFVLGSADQITPGAETGFGRETAEINVVRNKHRKGVDAQVGVVLLAGADRAGRTSYQGHHGEASFRFSLGLMMNAALLAVVTKDCRRQLAARIAINARGVNKKIAAHVLRQPFENICHKLLGLISSMMAQASIPFKWRLLRTC